MGKTYKQFLTSFILKNKKKIGEIMGLIERVFEAIIAIFIIAIFVTAVFPALGEATGQDVTLPIILMILIAVAVVASIFKGVLR